MAAANPRLEARACSRLGSVPRSAGRTPERMAQALGILAGHREVVVPLEALDPVSGVIVECAAHSHRPVAEIIENALKCAQLPERDNIGDRIEARSRRHVLRARTR